MTYRVDITADAEQAILEQGRYIARDKPVAAEKWLAGIRTAIEGLRSMPRRHPVAEAVSADLGFEVRRLIVGSYLIFYRVDDERRVVEVLRFRHGARLPESH